MEKFKVCPNCQKEWETRSDFIYDPEIEIIGYQVHFKDLERGFFLFNHSCNGTMSIQVDAFSDMYKGPIFEEKLTGSDQCHGLCLHQSNLKPCPEKCECAYVREVIQIVKNK
ncbi:MAG: hypothetical protein K9N09_05330 [Candidatus Cloacimonetes bacterium]|nr:hypothetical protein [Candidatus Cloacimonadota bacterium]MCF7815270.1 hypothetical protein [Candidatus Cloacimonadota bacterium]MCF7868105.1 hypothetical protein [Candidatus Cloacimonadota bacterium]MCF7883571.1 hypothetical protein [Candidatus Cloacimonadota bacterium]